MMRSILLTIGLMVSAMIHGQQVFGPAALQDLMTQHRDTSRDTSRDPACLRSNCLTAGCQGLHGTGVDGNSHVGTPSWYDPTSGVRSAIFVLDFAEDFPEEAQPAVQYAVDIWASSIESVVPIRMTAVWDSLSPSILAQASPFEVIHDFPGAPVANRQYAIALANQLAGEDLSPDDPDMVLKFSDQVSWYHGVDGQTPSGVYDMVTVALHEMAHGLGYLGSANHNGNSGFIGFQGVPFIYDEFVELSDQSSILDFVSGTVSLGNVLESDALYWGGDQGVAANILGRPRLYAPSNWAPGASYSHLRESSYVTGNINSLMTPFLSMAESIHTPGPVSLGMMQDMGWTLPPVLCNITMVEPLVQSSCNPATNAYTQQLRVTYDNPPSNGSLVVNGVSFAITSSPQTVSLVGLPSNGLPVDVEVYFSENPACFFTVAELFEAPAPCCVELRMVEVNPQAQTITLTNVGSCEGDLSGYTLKSYGLTVNVGSLAEGTLLAPGETTTVSWPGWPDNVAGGDLTLYDGFGDYDDYVQWLTAGNSGEFLANIYGLWVSGGFLDGLPPYTYIGDPSANPAEHGLAYWEAVPYPCAFLGLDVGATSECNPQGNDFTQEFTFTMQSPPASGTSIMVQDSVLTFDGNNPWSILLTLPATGSPVDVVATVVDDPACTATFAAAMVAPESCACPTDLDGGGFVDVNDLLLFLGDYGCLSGCNADFDGDDIVNVNDLLIFLGAYGSFCN
jgi:hypothetical protein